MAFLLGALAFLLGALAFLFGAPSFYVYLRPHGSSDLGASRQQNSRAITPAQPNSFDALALPGPQGEAQPNILEPALVDLPEAGAHTTKDAQGPSRADVLFGIVDDIVGNADPSVVQQLVAQFVPYRVGNDFDYDLRRLPKLPNEIGAVSFGEWAGRHLHAKTHQHIGHQGGVFGHGEQAHIGHRHKAPPVCWPRPGRIETLREQAHLPLRKNAVHRLAILDNQMGHIGFDALVVDHAWCNFRFDHLTFSSSNALVRPRLDIARPV